MVINALVKEPLGKSDHAVLSFFSSVTTFRGGLK